nr:hypothetical protein BaRGS_033595 [Batillaria attramentaria]
MDVDVDVDDVFEVEEVAEEPDAIRRASGKETFCSTRMRWIVHSSFHFGQSLEEEVGTLQFTQWGDELQSLPS